MPCLPAIHVIDDEREMRYSINMRLRNPGTIPSEHLHEIHTSIIEEMVSWIHIFSGLGTTYSWNIQDKVR